ncbi:MAG: SRPBCC domain-containing protein [Bacteroidota bacterium]|nr:SRPBCC domain-containing protein [Bacteroidota bacterium]
MHECILTNVVKNNKIAYSWCYDGYPGNSLVTFELFEEGNKTQLKLTHEGVETFVTEDSNSARESFTEGWTYIIDKGLKNYVEKL